MSVRNVLRVPSLALVMLAGSLLAFKCSAGVPPSGPNGPPRDPTFFPLAVWWQQANSTGHSGPYPSIAAAAAAAHMTIFLGQGASWPERFGQDDGEIEAVKATGMFLIGGITVPYNENNSAQSVASILALAKAADALPNLVGYNAGDEPQCVPGSGQTAMDQVATVVAGISSYDPTRIVTFNQTDWMIQPQWQHNPAECLAWDQAALQATSVGSFDIYPLTSPWIAWQLGVTGSDFQSVGNDSLWVQGLSVQALQHFALSGQPLWVYVEAGGDNFGLSEANGAFAAATTAGSTTLANTSGRSHFTSSWVGLTVAGGGIPSGTTITGIVDPLHATLSAAATATGTGPVAVTGGVAGLGGTSDCVASVNLCVVNGNEYRPTAAQVTAEVWMSLINGATGIEYFCHDAVSYSFCLGDSAAGGAAATAAWQNLRYIDAEVLRFAPVLNAPSFGQCSMESLDFATGTATAAASCSGGALGVATADAAVPGTALAKSYQGGTFLFAQPDRRSAAGARFTFTLAGLAGRTATVVYDSDERYDRAHASRGARFALSGAAQFSDTLGADHDDYQVKVYRIE